jgi:hypothetical protein
MVPDAVCLGLDAPVTTGPLDFLLRLRRVSIWEYRVNSGQDIKACPQLRWASQAFSSPLQEPL